MDIVSNTKPQLPDVITSKLTTARKTIGLTLKQVSQNIGLPVSTLSDIENGKRHLSAAELYKFAQLYHRPITFFFEENRSSASFALLFRAATEEQALVDKKTIVEFHELCHDYKDLITMIGAPKMPSTPDYSDLKLSTIDEAEDLAETERSQLGLNGQPIKDIYDLLEAKRGVKIFNLPEDPEAFSGAFACDEELGSCFLINSRQPKLRRTFTVAHEYAHCITHRNQLAHIDTYSTFQTRNPRERFANAFAAAFLMPRRTVNEVLSQLLSKQRTIMTAEVIIHLARYFGVSFEATGWRLISLRKLPRSKWDEIRLENVTNLPTNQLLGYSNEVDNPSVCPLQYEYLAHKAYREKRVSFERLAELLRRNYFELREEFN